MSKKKRKIDTKKRAKAYERDVDEYNELLDDIFSNIYQDYVLDDEAESIISKYESLAKDA